MYDQGSLDYLRFLAYIKTYPEPSRPRVGDEVVILIGVEKHHETALRSSLCCEKILIGCMTKHHLLVVVERLRVSTRTKTAANSIFKLFYNVPVV